MKNIKKIIAVIIAAAAVLMMCTVPSGAVSDNCKKIYSFLTNEMGLNSAAACGVLANIEKESDFNPNLYGDSGSSYGICQWHADRFSNLRNYCDGKGYSWKSLDGQLQFLKYELSNNRCDTGYIIDKLKAVSDTASGAYQAGYDWCYYFERPANKTAQSQSRGNLAMNYYWPVFGGKYTAPAKPVVAAVVESIGDINADGKIDSGDALVIIQASVGSVKLSATQKKAADLDGDAAVTSSDALIVLDISTGMDSIKNYK